MHLHTKYEHNYINRDMLHYHKLHALSRREDSADQEYSNGVIISIAFTCIWKQVVIEFNYLNEIEKF